MLSIFADRNAFISRKQTERCDEPRLRLARRVLRSRRDRRRRRLGRMVRQFDAFKHRPTTATQEDMRHSDPRLTMRVYTDERQIGVAAEVAKLPDFGLGASETISAS
jgi:hypothetical protein